MNISKYLISTVILGFSSFHLLAEDVPESVTKLAPSLAEWGKNPVLITEVKAQNAKGMTLDAIKARDDEWKSTSGMDAGMEAMMANNATKELMRLEATEEFFTEVFLIAVRAAGRTILSM